MQETKHVPQFNARSVEANQLATYSAKLFPAALRTRHALAFLVMMYGVIPWEDMGIGIPTLWWWFPEMTASFLLFAKRAGEKYGVSSRDILVELGRRRTVGGQEDMIEDLALDMARAKRS